MHCISLATLSRLSCFPLLKLAQIDLFVPLNTYQSINQSINQSVNGVRPHSRVRYAVLAHYFKNVLLFECDVQIAPHFTDRLEAIVEPFFSVLEPWTSCTHG